MNEEQDILFFVIKFIIVVFITAVLNEIHTAIYDVDMNRMTLIITGIMGWFIVEVGDT